jgi:hypothetical protein
MVAAPTLEQLPEEDRRLVETWRTEFERGWRRDRLAERVRELPPGGDPRRLPALLEIVRVDLSHRWKSGERIRLEAYLKALPELGTPETVRTDLILEEILARRRAGELIDPAKFARRFPRQAAELALDDVTRPEPSLPQQAQPESGIHDSGSSPYRARNEDSRHAARPLGETGAGLRFAPAGS